MVHENRADHPPEGEPADGQRDDRGRPVLEADQGHDGDDRRHDGDAERIGGVEATLAVDRGGQHADHEGGQRRRRCAARAPSDLRAESSSAASVVTGSVRVNTPASFACLSSGSRELIPGLRIGDRLCARSLPLIRPSWHPSLVASGGQVTPVGPRRCTGVMGAGVTRRSRSPVPEERSGEAGGPPPPSPARRRAACYLGIVAVRQGPPPGGDTTPLTTVTSDLASGRLHAAAANDELPNPPGYALMTAPLVALFGSAVGSPTWCTTQGRAADLHRLSGVPPRPHVRPGRVRVRVRAPARRRGDRRATAAVVPGAGDSRRGRLARPRRGRPRTAVGRRRGLGRPRGGPAGLPGRPARREQRDRAALPPPGHRQPRARPRRHGLGPETAVDRRGRALRSGRAHEAVRAPPAAPGAGGGAWNRSASARRRGRSRRLRSRDRPVLRVGTPRAPSPTSADSAPAERCPDSPCSASPV